MSSMPIDREASFGEHKLEEHMKTLTALALLVPLSTSAFAASSGTIDCRERSSVSALERPGSIVIIRQLSCDQKISIIGWEQGYAKVQVTAAQSGFVDARHVRMLETQDAPAQALESAPPQTPLVTGFTESSSSPNFLTKRDSKQILSSRKSGALSFLLSLLIPGGGQYYNGQYLKGALMTGISLGAFAGAVAAWDDDFDASNSVSQSLLLVGLGGGLWSMIDAPISSAKINRDLESRFLSWNVNKKMNISIKPDVNLVAPSPTARSLSYGAKLTLFLK